MPAYRIAATIVVATLLASPVSRAECFKVYARNDLKSNNPATYEDEEWRNSFSYKLQLTVYNPNDKVRAVGLAMEGVNLPVHLLNVDGTPKKSVKFKPSPSGAVEFGTADPDRYKSFDVCLTGPTVGGSKSNKPYFLSFTARMYKTLPTEPVDYRNDFPDVIPPKTFTCHMNESGNPDRMHCRPGKP